EVHQPAPGPRWPRRGDPVHVLWSPHGPPGGKEGRGWGSPRLRLVTRPGRNSTMSRIGKVPVPVPAGVDVTIDGPDVVVKGPKGTLTHTIPSPISVARGEDGTIVVTRPNDERVSKS